MSSKVSVILPTFNRSKFLNKSIESVLGQTYKDLEVLVIDDGSTDDTKIIVEKYAGADNRVRYFFQENSGQGSARNMGLKNATGQFITFLDSDDFYLPTRLEQMVQLFKNRHVDFCSSSVIIRENWCERKQVLKNWHNKDKDFFLKNVGLTFAGMNIFLTKNLADRIGFFETRIKHWEDVDFIVRAFDLGDFDYIDTPLLVYGKHGGNISNTQNLQEFLIFYNQNYPIYKKYAVNYYLDKSLGVLFLKIGKVKEARKCFIQAIKQKPGIKDFVKIILFLLISFLPQKIYSKILQ